MRRALAFAAALLVYTESAEAQSALSRRPDERRPSQQLTTTLFGGELTFGGQYELTHETRHNFDLDSTRARDRSRLEQELKAELFYRATPDASLFFQVVGLSQADTHRASGARTSESALERGQMWVYVDRVPLEPMALQAGRIVLAEPRTWWWDQDLDALRLFAGRGDWLLETGLAREVGPKSSEESHVDPEQEKVTRWFGRAAYQWQKGSTVEAYWLHAQDSSPQPQPDALLDEEAADRSDARLSWLGFRVVGDHRLGGRQRLGYWVDAAWVRGRETVTDFRDADAGQVHVGQPSNQSVRGQALDAGIMWTLPGAWRPTITAAYARGSGDGDPGDTTDRAYRQTGLQENKGRYRGVNRFRYYGELLRPELSNLEVRSLAFGFRFLPRSSLELVLHDYRQVHAAPFLPSDRLDASPRALDRSLGREVDLILGVREWERIELAARLGVFRAGKAFGSRAGEDAALLELTMTLVF